MIDKKKEKEKEKGKGSGSGVGNVFKKIVSSGFDVAASRTEGAVKVLSELNSSKELIKDISQGILKSTKEEIINAVSRKVEEQLQKLDIQKELRGLVEDFDIEIVSKISLKKKEVHTDKSVRSKYEEDEENED
ncbi:MAG: hypothetical protein HQK51_12955 [Oligoflexia bacterium]|nr:hypothetical protein [Oligoflexia bacterium]